MSKIVATVKTDFKISGNCEIITQIYTTQKIEKGFYVVHDHQESKELLGNHIERSPEGIGEITNSYERTIVLIPKDEFEAKLKNSGNGGFKPVEGEKGSYTRSQE